jgi:hypothetical protein
MANYSGVRLSEVAIIIGLVFVLSAIGCGKTDSIKAYKINAPTIHFDADQSVKGFKDFESKPEKITSAHYLKFNAGDASELNVRTTCTVQNSGDKVKNIDPVMWQRKFTEKVYFMELLPLEVSLKPFAAEDLVICSFDFIAQKDGSAHSFRLLNVNIDPAKYIEEILWNQPASSSAKNFGEITAYEKELSKRVTMYGFDLFCSTGSARIFLSQNSPIDESAIKTNVEGAEARGELTWTSTVQDCTLARVESGIAIARSKGFVLSFAPSVKISFLPNGNGSFESKNTPPQGLSFSGSIGEVSVKNESDQAVKVVIPKRIANGANVSAIAESNRRSLEAKYYCQYQAVLYLFAKSGEVTETDSALIVQLGPFDNVKLNAMFNHDLLHGGVSAAGSKGGAGREVFVTLNDKLTPFIEIHVQEADAYKLVSHVSLTSGKQERIFDVNGTPSKTVIGSNSILKAGATTFCRIREKK